MVSYGRYLAREQFLPLLFLSYNLYQIDESVVKGKGQNNICWAEKLFSSLKTKNTYST